MSCSVSECEDRQTVWDNRDNAKRSQKTVSKARKEAGRLWRMG